MDTKILAGLVAQVIKTGDKVVLNENDNSRFYREFEASIVDKIESMRVEKRRAYEGLKNIAIK